MNFHKQILLILAFFAMAYLATATNESTTNNTSAPSGPAVTKEFKPSKEIGSKRSNKRGMNRGKAFSGRSGYYSQQSYNSLTQDPSTVQTYSKINSRDSSAYSLGTPITSSGIGSSSSYSSTGSVSSSSGYPSTGTAYSQSYPAPAYSSPAYSATAYSLPSPYPVPSYTDDDLVHNYDDDDKKKKIALSLGISLPLALVLGPLALIGILALLNLRAVFTIAILRSLCNNDTFRANFGGLCTLIDNLKKRSGDEAGFKSNIDSSPHYSRLMSFLSKAGFSAMDHLNTVDDKEK